MNDSHEPLPADASACAVALAAGRTTARGLTEAYLAAIAQHNPRLGAYWFVDASGARAAAAASDRRRMDGEALGPLDGIPLAIKANVAVARWPLTAGLRFRAASTAAADAPAIARLRAQGAVLLGVTSMDEGALGAEGVNPWYGITHHPLRHGHSAGGSSAGSGAAVAADLCAAALGTDTIGSLRIPAAFCGCASLKPSPGRIDIAGLVPVHLRFDHLGPMARSVRDLELLFTALTGEPGARRRASGPPPAIGASGVLGYAVGLDALSITDEVMHAYQAGLATLRRQGAALVPLDLRRWDLPRLRRAILALCEMQMWEQHREHILAAPEDYSDGLRAFIRYGGRLAAEDGDAAERRIATFAREWQAAGAPFAAVLLPSVACTAFPHGARYPHNTADLAAIATAAGQPAASLPLPVPAGVLPVGLQVVAAAGSDLELLRIAATIEAALAGGGAAPSALARPHGPIAP